MMTAVRLIQPRASRFRLSSFVASLVFLIGAVMSGSVSAQQVQIPTGTPSSASSGSGSNPMCITFCINNTRITPVTLKGIDNYMASGNSNVLWKLYYSATSLSGAANTTTWTPIDSAVGPIVTSTNIYPLLSTINFTIPAGATYRFALICASASINYGGSGVTPNTHTVAGINLFRGDYQISSANVGYAGPAASPGFQPRFFCGTVYLDTMAAICTGTPGIPTITTTPFTTATALCSGSTTILNATSPNLGGGISHQWQSGPSATGPWTNVTNGSGATTLSYTTGPVTANTYYRLAVLCANSSITSYSIPFLVPIGSPQPGIISGLSTYCPGDPEVYSVPFISGGVYTWTLPPGWTGFSTTNSITVTPGPGTSAQTISVTVTSPCGPMSIARTRSILPGSAPGPPGTINGNQFICGNTAQTYSVPAVGGAASYVWTLPPGWTGSSTTNTINVSTNSNSGTISVKAINGCGQSSVNTLAISVISALPNPGTITGPDTVCSGALNTYSIAPVNGATSYTWTLPSGWSGTTTGTSIQAFAGTASGTMKVTAYVACATSPVSDTDIVVRSTVNPSVTISAPTATLCQGTPITITAAPSFPGSAPTYQWRVNGIPVAAFGSSYTSNTLVKGDSVSVTMTSNAACATTTTAVSNVLLPNITPSVMPGVSINTVPPIVICKGTPLTFNTISFGTGATPSYQWYKNGTLITGATGTTYTDPSLNDGDTLSIEMTTSAACAVVPVAQSNKVGVRVDDPATPTVNISVSPSEVVTGDPLTFTATHTNGGATPDFQWMRNGVNIPFETGSTFTSSTLSPGDHITVRMLSYAACVDPETVSSNAIVLKSGGLGIENVAGVAEVMLYPNPSNGSVNVAVTGWDASLSGRPVQVDVMSAMGQSVYHAELVPVVNGAGWKTQLQLGDAVSNGSYFLRLSAADGAFKASLPFQLKR